MTPMQIAFLVLVFVVVMGTVMGISALLRPSRSRQRLADIGIGTGDDGPERDGGWLAKVASLTRPIAKLSAPEEGFEKSNLKLRFAHAGIRGSAAPGVFFGIKTALTLGLPMLAFAGLTLSGSGVKGAGLTLMVLLAAAAGYYGPNVWLGKAISKRQRDIFENF